MLKEALEFLTGLQAKALAPVKLESGDPKLASFAYNGSVVREPRAKPPRQHTVNALGEIPILATRFAEAYDPVIWYDKERVVLVIDDEEHRLETVRLDLRLSAEFMKLETLEASRPWFTHKDFIRLLRIDLRDALPPSALLEIVRKVRFDNGTVTTSNVKRQGESMGREIVSAVSAEKDIPEEVTLNVQVYRTAGASFDVAIPCSVEVDSSIASFRLLPLPDALESAIQFTLAKIRAALDEDRPDTVPAYHGRP